MIPIGNFKAFMIIFHLCQGANQRCHFVYFQGCANLNPYISGLFLKKKTHSVNKWFWEKYELGFVDLSVERQILGLGRSFSSLFVF